jgi:hypothetical protein
LTLRLTRAFFGMLPWRLRIVTSAALARLQGRILRSSTA